MHVPRERQAHLSNCGRENMLRIFEYSSYTYISYFFISSFTRTLLHNMSVLFGVCRLLASHLLTRSWDVSTSYIYIYSFTDLPRSIFQVAYIQHTFSYQKLRLYSGCEHSHRTMILLLSISGCSTSGKLDPCYNRLLQNLCEHSSKMCDNIASISL